MVSIKKNTEYKYNTIKSIMKCIDMYIIYAFNSILQKDRKILIKIPVEKNSIKDKFIEDLSKRNKKVSISYKDENLEFTMQKCSIEKYDSDCFNTWSFLEK